MRTFITWLAITLGAFGAASGAYHFYLINNPAKVLVIVDSSYPMRSVWPKVPRVLDEIDNRRYTDFGLLTEKNVVHEWSPRLTLGRTTPYAPRDLSDLNDLVEKFAAGEVDRTYFITNAEAGQTDPFGDWEIIQLTP